MFKSISLLLSVLVTLINLGTIIIINSTVDKFNLDNELKWSIVDTLINLFFNWFGTVYLYIKYYYIIKMAYPNLP